MTTLSDTTVYVTSSDGEQKTGLASFDFGLNRVHFVLYESLAPTTNHTVTITTGVRDTSGNSLAADYAWSFQTAKETFI